MASIYDKASLVLIPSGTKTSKVYSQVPTNGDGDFTFSRSTAATRVNASGNIEKETQNLFYQSNTFSSGYWNYRAGDSSTGGQSGYDGTNDAWLLSVNSGGWSVYQNYVMTGVYTFSLYVKAGTIDVIQIDLFSSSTTHSGQFNLTSGTDAGGGNTIDRKITDVGGGWYRVSIAANVSSTLYARIGSVSATGNFYIQDAQLEQGLVARDYIETTTTAIYGGITDNVPRLDYTDSSCPALLLEPQRTNIINQSEYFGASDWVKTGLTIASNKVTSPDGNLNGTEVTISNGFHFLFDIISVSPSTTYTFSWYAKRGTATNVSYSVYDDTNGVDIISSTSYYSQLSDTEWKRISVQFTTSATTTSARPYVLRDGGQTGTISIYGAQLEAGSYATSYIPTYGSAVTRNAEVCLNTNTSNIVGQTEGTMYWEGTFQNEANPFLMQIRKSGNNYTRSLYLEFVSGGIRARAFNEGSVQAQISIAATTDTHYKVAFAYANNDFQLYVNGVSAGSDTSGIVQSGLSDVFVGNLDGSTNSAFISTRASQALLFPTRLSNEELATLTTI